MRMAKVQIEFKKLLFSNRKNKKRNKKFQRRGKKLSLPFLK